MSDQQATTTTIRAAVAARCRAAIEQHSLDISDTQWSVSEIVTAAVVAPIRRPRGTILTIGVVFVIVAGGASLVPGGIGEAIRTAALFGVVSFAALLLANDHRPLAADHRQPSHADERDESSAHSTARTEVTDSHD